MLPNVHISYFPAAQLKIRPLIPGDIIPDLLIPISQIRFRLTEASRASVPKTAIDEYGETKFREIHIRASRDFSAYTISTYPHRPKIFPERDLEGRVLAADAGHQITSFFFRNFIHPLFPGDSLIISSAERRTCVGRRLAWFLPSICSNLHVIPGPRARQV